MGTVDTYTVRLAVAGRGGHQGLRHRQRGALAAGGAGRCRPGDSVLVSTDPASFVRNVVQNGVPQTVRNRAVVLVFDSTNWNQAQTVYVAAANDSQAEGKRASR